MTNSFDIAVIGGGIIGSAVAYECAVKGLSVVLIEKNDFSSETSAGSFKIIHGGLRYLQHLDFRRLRESAEEQYLLRKNASHLIRPLPFLVPCYGYGMKGRSALRLACSVYEYLTKNRNRNLPESLRLPNHVCMNVDEVLRIAPHLDRKNLQGGVVFYDCQMRNSDRLSLSVVKSAEQHGACVKNYHEVVAISTEASGSDLSVSSLKVRSRLQGTCENIRVKFVINAMGPWAERVFDLFDDTTVRDSEYSPKVFYSKGIQIVLPEVMSGYAVSLESRGKDTASRLRRGGRSFFLQPWNGKTLAGTTDTIYSGDPSDFSISAEEVKSFLDELNAVYPSDVFSLKNVEHAFGGLRAISGEVHDAILRGENRDGLVNTTRDEVIIDHSKEKIWGASRKVSNLLSLIGVKYTTFRSVSEEIVSMLGEKGFSLGPVSTRDICFYGAPDASELDQLPGILKTAFETAERELEPHLFKTLVSEYGLESKEILAAAEKYIIDEKLSPQHAVLKARVDHAFNREYAKTLGDILFRRLSESSHRYPGDEFIRMVAGIFSQRCGYGEAHASAQMNEVKNRYLDFYFIDNSTQ
jgi:glycerol-3-phosphate dehydrogenase